MIFDEKGKEGEEERNKEKFVHISRVYKHNIFIVYKHLIFIVHKPPYCCVCKRPYYGLILTIFGAKKISSIFQNLDFSSRTCSSVDFFSLYWLGPTFSFFPLFINNDIQLFINSFFYHLLNNFCLFDMHFLLFINACIALFINGVYLTFMNDHNIGDVIPGLEEGR